MSNLYQVTVQNGEFEVPVTAGHLEYPTARQVADGMIEQYKGVTARIVDETTKAVVYEVQGFAENVIPIRPGIRPEGVEHERS